MRRQDPLEALENKIELVLSGYESGNGSSWADVEELLSEGYGRLLSLEALCTRLEGQPTDGVPLDIDLDEFRRTLTRDAARLRESLGRFRTRGLDAQRRFAAPPAA